MKGLSASPHFTVLESLASSSGKVRENLGKEPHFTVKESKAPTRHTDSLPVSDTGSDQHEREHRQRGTEAEP